MTQMVSKLNQVPELLKGAASIFETVAGLGFSRLPAWASSRIAGDLMVNFPFTNGSGVRLSFKTDASKISLKFLLTNLVFGDMPAQLVSGATIVDGQVTQFPFAEVGATINPIAPNAGSATGKLSEIEIVLEPTEILHEVEIWLPQNCAAEIVELTADGALFAHEASQPKWVHYGSSISHCGEADGPLGVWPVIAAKELNLDLFNLGVAGQAQLDNFAARTVVEQNPDLISIKIGINTVNANSLNGRTFPYAVHGFLDTIRDSLPNVPILVSTAIFCPPHEAGFAPTIFNTQTTKAEASPAPKEFFPLTLNLAMTREIVEKVIESRMVNDPNLSLMSGLDLFGEADASDLPDDLHPNADGYKRMGYRFADHPAVKAWIEKTA